jgi:hypothetical protein
VNLDGIMHRVLSLLAIAAAAAAATEACTPSSRVYVGPPRVLLRGIVQVFEQQQALPNAEVCVFGTDTLCVRTDQSGTYQAGMAQEMLLEGNSLVVRFRAQGLPTAVAEIEDIVVGETTELNCGISNRFTASTQPRACLPVQQ